MRVLCNKKIVNKRRDTKELSRPAIPETDKIDLSFPSHNYEKHG